MILIAIVIIDIIAIDMIAIDIIAIDIIAIDMIAIDIEIDIDITIYINISIITISFPLLLLISFITWTSILENNLFCVCIYIGILKCIGTYWFLMLFFVNTDGPILSCLCSTMMFIGGTFHQITVLWNIGIGYLYY